MLIVPNEAQHLLLVVSKDTGVLEDKTASVSEIELGDGKISVTYRTGSKRYSYKASRVRFFQDPVSLPVENTVFFVNGKSVSGVHQALRFGEWIKLFVGRTIEIHRAGDVRLDRNCLQEPGVESVMSYFKAIASLLTGEDQEGSFLEKELLSIDHLSEESILSALLLQEKLVSRPCEDTIVFPFGINQSQIKAVERALSNRISIIQGPPGTGKTQTILSIVANLLVQNKTVAVVSSNNSATDNVYEKLQSEGLGFVVALLGNLEKRKGFFEKISGDNRVTIPAEWNVNSDSEGNLRKQLENRLRELTSLLAMLNERASLNEQIRVTQNEMERFEATVLQQGGATNGIASSLKKWRSERLLRFLAALERMHDSSGFLHWIQAIRVILRFRVLPSLRDAVKVSGSVNELKMLYYRNHIAEMQHRIDEISSTLGSMGFDQLMEQHREQSLRYLRLCLWKRYAGKKHRILSSWSLQTEFVAFSSRYPVILSTTNSVRRCVEKGCLFDYLIIDESSQVDLVTASLALSCCNNLVVVGDLLQLPHIVDRRVKDADSGLQSRFGVPEAFHYSKHNILSSLNRRYGNEVPQTLLREHYRCHPQIIRFCNQKYYRGELIVMSEGNEDDQVISIVRTAPGNHERRDNGSWHNQRQLDVIRLEILPSLGINPKHIGVVTPYRAQAERAKSEIGTPDLLFETVHKFQGREKQAIILSPVRSELDCFNDDPNLVNVAVSRAKRRLVVVIGDKFSAPHGSNLGDLVRYIQFTGKDTAIQQSKVVSIFDCLYSEYSAVLEPFLQNVRWVSDYKSENLMYALLRAVLKRERFSSISIVMHYPLWDLVSQVDGLTEQERSYAMHPFTHVDFVLFNRLNKEPVLAIEVDGYGFHGPKNKSQMDRDTLKDAIFKKTNLPFERFSTIESSEEAKLVALLGGWVDNEKPL